VGVNKSRWECFAGQYTAEVKEGGRALNNTEGNIEYIKGGIHDLSLYGRTRLKQIEKLKKMKLSPAPEGKQMTHKRYQVSTQVLCVGGGGFN